jgi:hypothetical protein
VSLFSFSQVLVRVNQTKFDVTTASACRNLDFVLVMLPVATAASTLPATFVVCRMQLCKKTILNVRLLKSLSSKSNNEALQLKNMNEKYEHHEHLPVATWKSSARRIIEMTNHFSIAAVNVNKNKLFDAHYQVQAAADTAAVKPEV